MAFPWVLFMDIGTWCMGPGSNFRLLPAHLEELLACAHRTALTFVAP